jgi:hypothetical protein
VGRVHGVQKTELLAPKDQRIDLNVAFEGIVVIGNKKVNIFPLLRLNQLLACCPIVLCMLLW